MRDTTRAKNRLLSLYLNFAAKNRTLLRTWDTIFPSTLPVSAKVAFSAIMYHFQCINIVKTNTRYTHRAYLPVMIWVYLCIVMIKTEMSIYVLVFDTVANSTCVLNVLSKGLKFPSPLE